MVRKTRQSGQALVAATFGLVALLGATGLAIDMGFLRYQKRLQQSAADSAALAAAGDIAYIPDGANVQNTAIADSSLNGFPNGGKVTVTANNPPKSGAFVPTKTSPNTQYVEVLVSVDQPTFFMNIFGFRSVNVTARSVAVAAGKNCIYGLQNGISGTPTFPPAPPPPCGIIDNQALVAQGAVPAADPLAYLQPPAPTGGCLVGAVTDTSLPAGNPVPLPAGTYCSGISVIGNRDVSLSGVYVVTGGGISLNGKGTVTGTDLTLYLGATGGAVAINTGPGSSQTVKLTAPTAGALAGILFYQDPADNSTATIDGNGASKMEGAFYFPSATLNLQGTGTAAAYTIAVTKSLVLTGTTHFPANYSSLPGGSPVKTGVLVE